MNENILRAALFCPGPDGWGLPILMWGAPGIGKTSLIRSLAQRAGFVYERLSPAERGEGQFGVVPVPHSDGHLYYPAPAWAARMQDSASLLFVDEINTAAPALQAPLLGLVQLRTLGTFQFGKRTRIIAAANETRDAAGGWDLAPALANRFGHFDFEGLDAQSWVAGFLGGFATDGDAFDATAEEARVMAAWPSADAYARGLVGGFITRRPELLHKQPQKLDDAGSRAWPSRRTWEYAAVALASARVHGLSEVDTDEFLGGFVGHATVAEFAAWRADANLPDPADVLDGRVQWKHDNRRIDRTIAVLGACAALVAPAKAERRKERGGACWRLLAQVMAEAADAVVPAARALTLAKLYGGAVEGNASGPVLNRLHPILTAAGITA